ncbi:MAG TPA: hypothetical protein VF115_09510 [Acidimicrobiia bacterium]
MIRALKIVLATYGVGLTVVGLSYLLLPEEMSELQGAEVLSAFLVGTKMVLGASLLAVGAFVVIAAWDPIRQILWVRFAIVFALLFVTVSVYLGLFVKAEFSEVLDGIFIHGTFATLLLILYPRQTRLDGEQTPSPARGSETSRARGV